MTVQHDTTPAIKRRRRRRRGRKAPVAVVPLAQSDPAPPDPGKIEQPLVDPFSGVQYYPGRDTLDPPRSGPRNIPDPLEVLGDDDDDGPTPRGTRKLVHLTVAMPVRSHEILAWAAGARGVGVAEYLTQVMASVAASMRPEWRRSKTGKIGGSVRAADLGKFTE